MALPLSLAEASQIRLLEPSRVRFFQHGATLRLTLADEFSVLKVSVLRAFPLSSPDSHFSVRDGGGKEIGILSGLAGLDPDSRLLVEREVERRYLLFRIRRIVKVVERFGTVDWEVETDRGPVTFATEHPRHSALLLGPNSWLITDVDGNRYEVDDLARMPARDRGILLELLG